MGFDFPAEEIDLTIMEQTPSLIMNNEKRRRRELLGEFEIDIDESHLPPTVNYV